MKIKEKGLTGKTAANRKDSMANRPRGFNAFQEMAKGNKKAENEKPKPEIWLEFMGTRLRVHEENGGSVKEEDVPYVRGSTLKFTGCGVNVNFKDIKVCICPLLMGRCAHAV
jgi:lupus La protein